MTELTTNVRLHGRVHTVAFSLFTTLTEGPFVIAGDYAACGFDRG
jgi:hypothetical protein